MAWPPVMTIRTEADGDRVEDDLLGVDRGCKVARGADARVHRQHERTKELENGQREAERKPPESAQRPYQPRDLRSRRPWGQRLAAAGSCCWRGKRQTEHHLELRFVEVLR